MYRPEHGAEKKTKNYVLEKSLFLASERPWIIINYTKKGRKYLTLLTQLTIHILVDFS